MLVLLHQHGADQFLDRRVVGADAHHAGAPLDLLIDALEQVGDPDLLPVLGREVADGQHVLDPVTFRNGVTPGLPFRRPAPKVAALVH